MIFTETKLAGAFVIDLERREDDRGFFARAFCQHEFADHGLKPVIAQANIAYNRVAGTLRGMHFQFPPAAETKLVRCTRGAILDIIVDLRPESPTYLEHVAVELTADNHRALYVPERFAHGYQVLVDATETSYQVGEFYAPEPRAACATTTRGSGSSGRCRSPRSPTRTAPGRCSTRSRPSCRQRMTPDRGSVDDHRRHRAARRGRPKDARSASAWSAPASWARA